MNILNRKLIFYILLIALGMISVYHFYHRGLKVPVKVALQERRAGDFWSTFPAAFVERYNPQLRDKTIVKGPYKDQEWGYGPIQHLITLPLTFLTSIKAVSIIWLIANYIFLGFALFFMLKIAENVPLAIKALIAFIWMAYWPLHCGIEENVIEIFELFMIVLSLYLLIKHKDILAGVVLGIASMAKFLPVIFIVYFLAKRKFKAFLAMLVTILIIIIGTQFTIGWQNCEIIKRFFNEVKKGHYDFTYWRSQTIPSAVGRIFSKTDYSASEIYYPKLQSPILVKWIMRILIPFILLYVFAMVYRRRKEGDLWLEYGMISTMMFLVSLHGQSYYLMFSLIGYSAALCYVYQKKFYFGGLILFISYFLSGYIMQMREFDMILLPDYTYVNREVFFLFLSFPTYGVTLLFILLIMIYRNKSYLKKIE